MSWVAQPKLVPPAPLHVVQPVSGQVEQRRSLCWTASLTGAVALELAENIEKLFSVCDCDPTPAAAEALPAKRGKGGKGGKGGSIPRKPPPPMSLATHIEQWAKRCMEYVLLLKDLKAKLAGKPFAEKLTEKIVDTIGTFDGLHQTFVDNVSTPATDWHDIVVNYRAAVIAAHDFIVTADSMLNLKKRKFPAEPAEFKPVVVQPS
jgi:hypothetical protein